VLVTMASLDEQAGLVLLRGFANVIAHSLPPCTVLIYDKRRNLLLLLCPCACNEWLSAFAEFFCKLACRLPRSGFS